MLYRPIYLDYNATTPVDESVLEEMLPYFSKHFGNPSSKTHQYGWISAEAIEIARERVAAAIGSEIREVIFTSGATEALNLAILGLVRRFKGKKQHIISQNTEHKAVLDLLKYLEGQGTEVTYLQVNREGEINLDELKGSMREDTLAFICMYANNETGKLFNIKESFGIAKERGCYTICDATQAFGKTPLNVEAHNIDLMALSSHKIYGPKGCGALFFRRRNPRINLSPLLFGGGQELGLRPGTLATPNIVGFGKAAELATKNMDERIRAMIENRNLLEGILLSHKAIRLNSASTSRLPNTSNFRIRGIKAEKLISMLPQLAFSTGSACSSVINKPSHVLLALGLNEDEAMGSIRISTGFYTSADEIKEASSLILGKIEALLQG